MVTLIPSIRTRSTPFTACVETDTTNSISGYTIYNHMLLPVSFNDMESDYWHLRKSVQIWDVSAERQVTIKGKDAEKLVQMMTPRFIGNIKIKQCYYSPLCDEFGGIVNDPIILKLDNNHFNLSIADSDVLLWAKGLAYANKMQVDVFEPDINPLAVQGPKSDALMAKIFGENIVKLKFFYFDYFQYKNHPLMIARSGWSKQGGFEIYLDNRELAHNLWQDIMNAGKEFDIRQGSPHLIERIEGGLLSYGNDMTLANNPYEVRLDKYVTLDNNDIAISKKALLDIHTKGITQRIEGIIIETETTLPPMRYAWSVQNNQNEKVGQVTSLCYSPALKKYIALAMINIADSNDHIQAPNHHQLYVKTSEGTETIKISDLPFDIPPI